ncbi:heterokaryon incompatibility protein-domain-containing protein, partial [Ilyonectria robusta]|uniref:heterokaryon incompatibility protein-domain-containing protein n=1 Tax=Ilyonectria robusta TaxID=1079257 RepID=UPI001E8D038C
YVCLSYCWGIGLMFKTTKENIAECMQSINFRDLLKIFKDAVGITRQLKKRYLWIDSLCIIQDDNKDWQKEGLRMHETYGNAYLTVAASRSGGPDKGLFSESLYHRLFWRKVQHFDSADGFPLLRRGWVFQEQILSRRVLHFGPQELVWECIEGEECECRCVNEGIDRASNTPKKSLFLFQNNIFLWNHIASAYSSLDLTKENDILPALAGVIKKYKPAADVRYLAGLWDGEFLLIGLFWYAEKKEGVFPGNYYSDLKPQPSPYRAPSWSWASVKNGITY